MENTRLGLVLDLTREVTARRDLDDVLATAFRVLHRAVSFTGGSIQLVDDEGWIRVAASDPPAPPHMMAMRIPLGGTVGGRIILTEQPAYVPDVNADAAVPAERRRTNVSRGVRSYLGVPLVADGRAIGVLQIDSEQPDAWSEADRTLVASLAPVVAAAIQNARAHAVRAAALRRLAALERRIDRARALLAEAREQAQAVAALGSDAGAESREVVASRLRAMVDEAGRLTATVAAAAALLDPGAEDEAPVAPVVAEAAENETGAAGARP